MSDTIAQIALPTIWGITTGFLLVIGFLQGAMYTHYHPPHIGYTLRLIAFRENPLAWLLQRLAGINRPLVFQPPAAPVSNGMQVANVCHPSNRSNTKQPLIFVILFRFQRDIPNIQITHSTQANHRTVLTPTSIIPLDLFQETDQLPLGCLRSAGSKSLYLLSAKDSQEDSGDTCTIAGTPLTLAAPHQELNIQSQSSKAEPEIMIANTADLDADTGEVSDSHRSIVPSAVAFFVGLVAICQVNQTVTECPIVRYGNKRLSPNDQYMFLLLLTKLGPRRRCRPDYDWAFNEILRTGLTLAEGFAVWQEFIPPASRKPVDQWRGFKHAMLLRAQRTGVRIKRENRFRSKKKVTPNLDSIGYS